MHKTQLCSMKLGAYFINDYNTRAYLGHFQFNNWN